MKIKEIKLYGFKSFRDESKVLLNTGVTAFVGPNGSGKSNIFDALRWVFGEQSMKALRCAKIEDLVHESADSKEDANFSEVALTIINEDYFPQFGSEFEIKRRFYRTGESEFFLNRVKCRLQDIQALFLNSGVLTYSFLELAEVERIIHGDTKEMFDDVAGILKYQERKEQTKRRLVATEQDLLRLEDIIAEMNRGLRGLRRQVRQARLYNELRTDYKDLKLHLMARELKVTLEEIDAVQSQIDDQEAERQSLLDSIKQLEDERAALKNSIESAEIEKKDNLTQIVEFTNAIESLQNEISLKEEEVRDRTILSERVSTSIREKTELVNTSRERLLETERERDEIESGLKNLQSRIEEVQAELDAMNAEYLSLEGALKEDASRISDTAVRIMEAHGAVEKLKYDRDNKERSLSHASDELSKQCEGLEEQRRLCNELDRDMASVVEQQDRADNKLKEMRASVDSLEKTLSETDDNLKKRDDGIADCRIMIDTLNRRLQVEGKKIIKEKLGDRVGGMFRDNIEVVSGYESVIDVCLSVLLDFYLLRDYETTDIANCPEGRFGFIDLAQEQRPSGMRAPEGAAPVAGFVKFKSTQNVLARYIENFFVVENCNTARSLSRQYPECGFVTKDGVLFEEGTIVVERGDIGYFRASQSLEEYKTRMESLRNESLFMKQERKRVCEELAQKQQAVEEIRNELFAINLKKSECSLKLDEVKKEFERRQAELSNVKEGCTALLNEIEGIKGNIGSSERSVEQLEQERARCIEESGKVEERAQQLKTKIDDTVATLNGISTEHAVRQGRRDSVDQLIGQLNQGIDAAESDIRALREQSMPASIAEMVDAINAMKEELGRKRQEKLVREARLPVQLLDEYVKRQGLVYDQLAQKQKDHESMQNSTMQLKYQLFEKNHRRDDLIHKAAEEFGVALAEYTPEEEMPDVQARLAEVKGRIEKLGEVNPLSMQAYEEEKKRLDEFLGQRDDIITAKKSLLRSIEELDGRARERFNDTFAQVRKEFNYVFANFFEDGQADLVLTDPENPLASKVEIVVRMMGRKLKTINQLSGGQKTLLAISLLLAFYLVKPAPFCILDEIDAPLDDINVVRFNRYLRDLSQRTQVVIITHNRATMEYADYLYGITMEKPRESKVISARLADLEKIVTLDEQTT
ncbi:chromosome segregation protein SMC [candidate division WOR-3 bacterium]|nr:chromosome segregation protein SMC [candidate division WOR-3 bacterium]